MPPPKNIIGFHFTGSELRIAFAKVSKIAKPELVAVKSCNLEGLSDDLSAKLIKDTIKEFKAKNPIFVTTVDSQSVVTKNIEVPSTNEKEIREIIDLQAGRYTPYARDEIIVDYINIDTYHNSYTKVLVVIVVQEIIRKQLALFSKAGINISKIQFSSESVGLTAVKLLGLSDKKSPSCLLSIDSTNSNFIIISKAKTIFVRNIPLGYDNFAQDKDASPDKFIEELKKSLEAYKAEDLGKQPDEIMLMGSHDIALILEKKISEALDIRTKNTLFYDYISSSKGPLISDRQLSYLNAASSAASFFDTKIDLRSSEIKLNAAFRQRSLEIIKSGMFALFIVVLACLFLLVKIHYRGLYLSRLENKIGEIQPEVSDLENDLTRIMIIKNLISNKNQALEFLSKLYDIVPENVYLKSVAVDEAGKIIMKGTTSAMSDAFSFVTVLENSGYFDEVSTQNTASRKELGKGVADFELSAILKGRKEKLKETTKNKGKEEVRPKAK